MIREAKGLPIIYACTKCNVQHPDVAKQLCKLFALLALDVKNQTLLIDLGVHVDIMKLVELHDNTQN